MRQARIRRQVAGHPHWSIYLGATAVSLGAVVLVVAALLTR
jgi:hypothetical protein